jgi:peptidoglycan/LPS O-acetylase OafA/YrhL
MTRPRHIPVLDGVRGVAVLMVIVFHFFGMRAPLSGWMGHWLTLAIRLGATGVDLFFVLSGFLITGILLDTKSTPHYLRNFFVRRMLRIFPLYYLSLVLLFFVVPFFHTPFPVPARHSQWWFWTYLQDVALTFSPNGLAGPNHFWSLAVEEHFYLVWPFLVLAMGPSALKRCLWTLIVATLGVRWGLQSLGYGVFYFTLCRLDGLAVGALLALWAREPGVLEKASIQIRRWMPCLGAGLALLYVLSTGAAIFYIQIVKSTLQAIVYGSVLILVLTHSPGSVTSRVFNSRILRTTGKYSYAMYVFHPYVIIALNPNLPLPALLVLGIEVAATFGIAAFSWYAWESPFLRLKTRFESGVRPLPIPGAP